MHAEARRGVDLDNGAADILVGLRNVGGQEIDAADVQADRLNGANRHFAVIRMNHVGHVDRARF